MKPLNSGGHPAYQQHVLLNIREYYPNALDLPYSSWQIINHFWYLDLSPVDIKMADQYSIFGPRPRLPSCMLRSMLLMLEFSVTSFTKWAEQLQLNPLYAILSGFRVGNTPGVGTFYDFVDRLWLSDDNNFNENIHAPKPSKVKRPSRKGQKADSVEKVTVDDLIKEFELNPPSTDQPFSLLFEIYSDYFLAQSFKKGLLDPHNLTIAGDGTPVVAAAAQRSKVLDNPHNLSLPKEQQLRRYSQPDCDFGWDSHRNRFYFGYDLYFLTACGGESELPLFPLLSPASRHDSIGFPIRGSR